MTIDEKVDRLNVLALREHEKYSIKLYKSYEDTFKKQAEYLLDLMESVTAQRNALSCTEDMLLKFVKIILGGKSMSENDMRELLVARKRRIGCDSQGIQNVFGAAASKGNIIRNGKNAVIKLYSHKLSLELTKKIIENLIPVGLKTEYVLSGGEWGYFDEKEFSFSQLDAMGLSWEELEEKEW